MTARALDRADLSAAMHDFAVANTPLYLFGKLRANGMVQKIGYLCEGKVIYSALREALSKKPRTLKSAVRPYAYLVALAMKGDEALLKRAAKLPSENYEWFSYIANVAIQAHRVTNTHTFTVSSPKPRMLSAVSS